MRISLLLFIAVLLGACQQTTSLDKRLHLAFDEAAHGTGVQSQKPSEEKAHGVITRWNDTIYYEIKIDKRLKDVDIKFIEESIDRFDDLLPTDFVLATNAEVDPNFIIHVKKRIHFTGFSKQKYSCLAWPKYDDQGNLYRSEIYLAGKQIKIAEDCLDHEMMHAVGMLGHTHRLAATISYAHEEYSLTKWDKFLIKTLYHPDIVTGMNSSETAPIVSEIIKLNYQP